MTFPASLFPNSFVFILSNFQLCSFEDAVMGGTLLTPIVDTRLMISSDRPSFITLVLPPLDDETASDRDFFLQIQKF